jgi:hypothetical protein
MEGCARDLATWGGIMSITFRSCFAVAFLLAGSPALAYEYSAAAIRGRLVDAANQEPIEGANVVAEWTLEFGLEGGTGYSWVVLETLTDADGRFTFPAWGPKPVPDFLPGEARLKGRDPKVVFFKYGYAGVQQTPQQAGKEYSRPKEFPARGPQLRRWFLDGETFLYRPAQRDPDRIATEVRSFDLFLGSMRAPCAFVPVGRALRALRQARERVVAEAPQVAAHFRYGRAAYARWLDGGAAIEAMQRKECGTTAREVLERTGG